MRLPNGYGTVYKLKDKKRRNPWVAKKNGRYIGYAPTKKDALEILAEYNASPWDIDKKKMTFKKVFESFRENAGARLAPETIRGYVSKYNNYCKALDDLPYSELRVFHFNSVFEDIEASNTTKNNIIKFLRALDNHAFELDIIDKKYTEFLKPFEETRTTEREPFTEDEIKTLWDNLELEDVDLVLIHIYLGMRPGELVDLKLVDIHLTERYLTGGNKTQYSKNRIIPIHKKIAPLLERRVELAKKDTLLNYTDKTYRVRFKKVMERLSMNHIPHECRHTLRTRLDNQRVNQTEIDFILGHKAIGTGKRVYTHKTLEQLIKAIDTLD